MNSSVSLTGVTDKVVSSIYKLDWEGMIPWIIGVIVAIILFPYSKIKQFFSPEPTVKYIEIPKYVYLPSHYFPSDQPPLIHQHQHPPPPPPPVQVPVPVVVTPEPPPPVVVPEPPKEFIVCAFGLENVLNVGEPARCLEMCRDTGCNLAILSASNKDNTNELPLENLGFVHPYYQESNYYYNPDSGMTSLDDAASLRLSHLTQLKNKYNIQDPKRVILFDNNRINIELAEKSGFSVVEIGTKNPGIQELDIRTAFGIIKSLN